MAEKKKTSAKTINSISIGVFNDDENNNDRFTLINGSEGLK